MNMQVFCVNCGQIIGQSAYATDGAHVFHQDCQKTVRYPRFHESIEKPNGNVFLPVAMNLTKCTGTEIVMVSLTEPSHCAGFNVMSMKLPFCTAEVQ